MKLALTLIALCSLPSYGQYSISLVSPIAGKPERVDISQKKEGGWLVNRTSNTLSPKDFRIGKLNISPSAETKKLLSRIHTIEQDMKATDQLITDRKQLDLEKIAAPKKGSHDDFVVFNERVHSQKSPFFDEIKSLINDFLKLPMELQDGAKLDAKQENLELLKNGKKIDSYKFIKGAYCSGIQKNLKCLVRDWGVIYIQ